MEDLAEQQITAEEHQRILAVLPNFYVSYLPDAAPLTRKQKFKLAVVVSRDPVTYLHHRRHRRHRAVAGRLRRLRPGFLRLRRALRRHLRRQAEFDLSRRRPAAIAAAPGPALLLPGTRPCHRARALRHLHGRGLQGRQWPLAAQLLQRSRQSRRGRNFDPLLSQQRSAQRAGHRNEHAARRRRGRDRDPLPGVPAPPPHALAPRPPSQPNRERERRTAASVLIGCVRPRSASPSPSTWSRCGPVCPRRRACRRWRASSS